MKECMIQDKEVVFAKLDRLWDNNIDYIEQLFGIIEEANVNDKSWNNLVCEFENVMSYYDEWSKSK